MTRAGRRAFLVREGRTALGLSLLPLAGCSRAGNGPQEPQAVSPRAIAAEFEAQIPDLLIAARVPGKFLIEVLDPKPSDALAASTACAGRSPARAAQPPGPVTSDLTAAIAEGAIAVWSTSTTWRRRGVHVSTPSRPRRC